MKEFWKWLHNKYGGCYDGDCDVHRIKWNDGIINTYEPLYSKQMLIGYMIEYCLEKKIKYHADWWYHRGGIEAVYKYLEGKIKKELTNKIRSKV